MEIPEKLATYGTQDEDKQNENTTQYILHKNTNDVNMTWALLPNTVGKDEPNIVIMLKSINQTVLFLSPLLLPWINLHNSNYNWIIQNTECPYTSTK